MNIEVLTIQDIELIKQLIIQELRETFTKSKKGKTWMKSEEAMDYLKCSQSTLKHLRNTKQIPYTKIGSRCLYAVEDIEALLDNNRNRYGRNNEPNKREGETTLSST